MNTCIDSSLLMSLLFISPHSPFSFYHNLNLNSTQLCSTQFSFSFVPSPLPLMALLLPWHPISLFSPSISPFLILTLLSSCLHQMRSLGISEVENFPFPTAPPAASLERALDLLVNLGAISPPQRVQNLDLAALAIGKREWLVYLTIQISSIDFYYYFNLNW